MAAAVESSGQAKAEAQAQAEKLLIEGQSAIECTYVGLCETERKERLPSSFPNNVMFMGTFTFRLGVY